MGRYYDGDIEGKFWFAIQSSNDADFFGVEGQSNYLHYSFDEDNLEDIKKGIETCFAELGLYHMRLKNYFEQNNGYNSEKLAKHLKISEERLSELLTWYARLELGRQIRSCVELQGQCNFEAEL
mgnify:CR=1 FL=1